MMRYALVVDDSSAMRKIQQRALESDGWTVTAAEHGQDALARLGEMEDCDLVLTDWHMPVMDGLELCRAIRGGSKHADVPILMITSDAVLDAIDRALDAGANDFLMKPFTADELRERIAEVVDVDDY